MNKTKVFTAGKQVDYTYSNDDVKAVADSYTETAYSAPWICGHDTTSGKPAMGWVRGLEYKEVDGVGELWALSDFNKAGQGLINAGLFENKSVSFYTPDSAFNPAPGQWSLRHIAMLGAEPPALKNLGPIAVIDYSEEDTAYVTYACSCMENKAEPMEENKSELVMEKTESEPEDFKETDLEQKYADLQTEFAALKQELDDVKNSAVKENIEEDKEVEETKMQAELSELEQVKKERDQLMAQLNASKEANTALSVSSAISPYYSEGVLTEDVLSEATLTNVITKLTLGSTNYAEEETPIIVIEKLLQALIGTKPTEPEYGETTPATEDFVTESPSYSDGDELHELAVKTASSYGLSYGQALSAVVTANETTLTSKVNFSESLADAVKTFKTK